MKAAAISTTMLLAILFTLTSCSSSSPEVGSAVMTYKKGVPGETIVQTFKVTATVMAIDQVNRSARLQGADGKNFTVQVGKEAVNFDQVRVGDQINVTMTQKMVVSLDHNAASTGEGAAAVVARAPEGGSPGSLAADTIQAIGEIVAIDLKKRTVTLQFEGGETQTFSVRPDTDLRRLKVGEREVIRVTEMIAIGIEKQP